MKIKCPQCGASAVYNSKNKWRPFCSERCKLIDLGDWIDEKKRIQDNLSFLKTQANNISKFKH